jgi:uncharacterized protein with ParB-like and HNH nuclease domain
MEERDRQEIQRRRQHDELYSTLRLLRFVARSYHVSPEDMLFNLLLLLHALEEAQEDRYMWSDEETQYLHEKTNFGEAVRSFWKEYNERMAARFKAEKQAAIDEQAGSDANLT